MTSLDVAERDYPEPAPEVGVLLAEVEPERVEWLWYGRIPLGKLTVLDGDPGLGKSTLTMDVAARVTRGVPMPGDRLRLAPAGVVILSAEDDLADTIRPRLDAADADVSRVLALAEVPDGDELRPPALPSDIGWLRAAVERVGARLVIVDPLMAFLDGSVDAHRDQEVRRGLHRLSLLAAETGAAVLVVRHLNKAAGANPLYRGGGSIGIIGAARAGLLVGRDPGDPDGRILATTKCNLAPEQPSLAFHIMSTEEASRLVWDGESTCDAASVLASPSDEERTARDEAAEFITDVLADGPVLAREIKRLAREAGISERTLKRAKREAQVETSQLGNHSGWVWSLPTNNNTHTYTHTPVLLAPWHSEQVDGGVGWPPEAGPLREGGQEARGPGGHRVTPGDGGPLSGSFLDREADR